MGLYTLAFLYAGLVPTLSVFGSSLGLRVMGIYVYAPCVGWGFLSIMTAGSAFVSLVKFLDENIEMYDGGGGDAFTVSAVYDSGWTS